MLLDGPVDVDEQLLLEEADPRPAGERHRTAVGRVEARDDPQQRGLAGAVRTDEPRPIAARQPEAHVAEQDPVGEPPARGLDRKDAHRPTAARGPR